MAAFVIVVMYRADGMTQALVHRQYATGNTVTEALHQVEDYLRKSYISGYQTLSWSAEHRSLKSREEREHEEKE